MTDNWEAAKELDRFYNTFIKPLDAKVTEAKEIYKTTKWKNEDQKARGKKKLDLMEGELINMTFFHTAVKKLVMAHENQTNMLTEIYAKWYKDIATEGIQPAEMMGLQAAGLQGIFQRIYDAIEPLKLELHPPQIINYDKSKD